MKHIKKFESFDFNQTLPVTTKNFLTNFYSCDECDALWKEFNKTSEVCKFCNCKEIEDLSEDEYYDLQKSRLDEDEVEDMESERSKNSEELVNLGSLDNEDVYYESKNYGIEILPQEALVELDAYVDYKNPENKIEVCPDPKVDGTYAVRVYRSDDGYTFDLLWNRGAFDEVEFSSWPPNSGNLKFFF
jgi:hypothetical protein